MYKSIVIVLWIPDIEDLIIFCATSVISSETAWKKIAIWSDETNSGNFAGRSAIKSKKLLKRLGTSKIKACSWIYNNGTSQITKAAPVTIKIVKVVIKARFWLTL